MTVCPICNGKGTQFIADYDGMYDIVCDKCKGKGELDDNGKPILTNEEWFCTLSTEEKAEVLFDIWYDGKVLAWDKSKPFYFNRFVTWLKEVHKDEM